MGCSASSPRCSAGEEEAYLSFLGATAEFGAGPAGPGGGPYLVVDIGGGSTEFVVGDRDAQDRTTGPAGISAVSVDIGCVRLTERHLHSDPPRPAEISAAAADIDAALDLVAGAIPVVRRPDPGGPGRLGDHGRRAWPWGWRSTTQPGSTTPGSPRSRSPRRPAACWARPARSGRRWG